MEDFLKTYQDWTESRLLTADEKNELFSIKDNLGEIKERFAVSLEFGTAGMRGVLGAGTNRMNRFTVSRATSGLAEYIKSLGAGHCGRGVVISYDTRRLSTEFAIDCAKVLSAAGIKAYIFEDVRPVPVCSFAVRELNAAAGIMITASHNPKQYNGYKVYGEDGAQMAPEATAIVVDFIDKTDIFGVKSADVHLTPNGIKGKDNFKADDNITVIGKSMDEKYFAAISKLALSSEAVQKVGKDIKIVYTPIHGSGYMPVCTILKRMGIPVNVVDEQARPDGDFPTVRMPNPEESDALKLAIALADNIGSDIVIGTDPDCDRMGVAVRDDKGKFVLLSGNQTGTLLMDYILSVYTAKGIMPANGAVVKTIVTTSMADAVAAGYGVTVFNVLTGFKFIGEKIKEWETSGEYTYIFGFEESFGYLAGTHSRDKDAVVASMLFAEMACYYKSMGTGVYGRLTQLYDKFGYYAEKNVSFTFGGLDGMDKMKSIMQSVRESAVKSFAGVQVCRVSDYLTGITRYSSGGSEKLTLPKTNAIYFALEGGDWLCVRPSGTEPKLKIYVASSAKTKQEADKKNAAYIEAAKTEFGL